MRYMQTFNRRLPQLRESRQLSRRDVAAICGVDEARVAGWEHTDPLLRSYPAVAELMDLCLQTGTPLDQLLDLELEGDQCQLELPGLAFSDSTDLSVALAELESVIERLQLTSEEHELLRRFRRASSENRRMILQLLGQ